MTAFIWKGTLLCVRGERVDSYTLPVSACWCPSKGWSVRNEDAENEMDGNVASERRGERDIPSRTPLFSFFSCHRRVAFARSFALNNERMQKVMDNVSQKG